ncbi:hypothetical protein [Spiroplasma taiwanense]|uniref:hypothetical protein n=1 Tax=Spiroplasma taiwanense TaxID=2145 RepID=UPI00041E0C01|nr:hypothetical protein [Spiroplasma taiwanense]
MRLKTILVVSGAIQDLSVSDSSGIQPDLFSYAFNIVAETKIKLFGIYMGYNTMKYLGGPTLLAIFMSLALAGATSVQFLTQMSAFDLFSIGTLSIKTGIFTNSVLPHIFAAIGLFYLDKWVKTWMPHQLIYCLNHLLYYL